MTRGYFGIGVYHPKTEHNIGTLYRSAYVFGAAFIFTIGHRYRRQASDTPCTPRHIPLYTYPCFDEFYAQLPHGAQLVCVELAEKAHALPAVGHPQQAVYLLGAEDYGLPEKVLRGHMTIQIPAARPFSLNVATAGSLVMYDRYVKSEAA